ncbi:MAG: hypothetical protein V8T86_10130 [Victivallis sp.]
MKTSLPITTGAVFPRECGTARDFIFERMKIRIRNTAVYADHNPVTDYDGLLCHDHGSADSALIANLQLPFLQYPQRNRQVNSGNIRTTGGAQTTRPAYPDTPGRRELHIRQADAFHQPLSSFAPQR